MFAATETFRLTRRILGVSVLALGFGAWPTAAQERPNFSGVWDLNAERSDDAVQQINEAAGTAEIQGQSRGRGNTLLLPKGNERSEVERIELRNWMLQLEEQFRELEIVHEGDEFKTYYGEDGVRIFYLNRPHVRTDMKGRKLSCKTRWEGGQLVVETYYGEDGVRIFYLNRPHVRTDMKGRKLSCKTRWEGGQLVVEQTGEDKTRVFELYTLMPGGKQLILAIRWESKWLKQPLELRSVYDLVDAPSS